MANITNIYFNYIRKHNIIQVKGGKNGYRNIHKLELLTRDKITKVIKIKEMKNYEQNS